MGTREDLAAATRRYRRAEKALTDVRDEVTGLVVKALREGVTPTEATDLSPFSASHVRNVAREAGIEPARPGPKPRKAPQN